MWRCNISEGDPAPTFKWTQDSGSPLPDISRFVDSGDGLLAVKSVKLEDAGQYTCQATNYVGSSSATGILNVQGRAIAMISLLITMTCPFASYSHHFFHQHKTSASRSRGYSRLHCNGSSYTFHYLETSIGWHNHPNQRSLQSSIKRFTDNKSCQRIGSREI